ncbi:unnamed protein product, partial [Polarella glacialis]
MGAKPSCLGTRVVRPWFLGMLLGLGAVWRRLRRRAALPEEDVSPLYPAFRGSLDQFGEELILGISNFLVAKDLGQLSSVCSGIAKSLTLDAAWQHALLAAGLLAPGGIGSRDALRRLSTLESVTWSSTSSLPSAASSTSSPSRPVAPVARAFFAAFAVGKGADAALVIFGGAIATPLGRQALGDCWVLDLASGR